MTLIGGSEHLNLKHMAAGSSTWHNHGVFLLPGPFSSSSFAGYISTYFSFQQFLPFFLNVLLII